MTATCVARFTAREQCRGLDVHRGDRTTPGAPGKRWPPKPLGGSRNPALPALGYDQDLLGLGTTAVHDDVRTLDPLVVRDLDAEVVATRVGEADGEAVRVVAAGAVGGRADGDRGCGERPRR